MSIQELLEEIGSTGYWVVTARPLVFQKERLELPQCQSLVEQCQVSLRGWNYPHYHYPSQAEGGISYGEDYVECMTEHNAYVEFWRFYQSGLFYHTFAVPEDYWSDTADRCVIDIFATLYRMTEIYEFVSRLATKGVFENSLRLKIELKNLGDRSLTIMDRRRSLDHYYAFTGGSLSRSRDYAKAEFVGRTAELSLEHTHGVLQRFGWLASHVRDLLREEQEKFLKGEYKVA